MITERRIAGNLGMCYIVMRRRIIDLIVKQGFKSSLKGIDMEQVTRYMKYENKNPGEKFRYVLPGTISDMAIDMEVSSRVMRKVPGDMQ